MSIKVIQNLSVKERQRKTEEAKKWLQEQGELPDMDLVRRTVFETYSLSQILIKTLHEHEGLSAVAVKLAGQMESLLNSLDKQ